MLILVFLSLSVCGVIKSELREGGKAVGGHKRSRRPDGCFSLVLSRFNQYYVRARLMLSQSCLSDRKNFLQLFIPLMEETCKLPLQQLQISRLI